MTERLADVTARIAGMRQLGSVVNAMRGIAGARAQQARGQLRAVEAYAATVAAAIGRALAARGDDPGNGTARTDGLGVVLFCAEQGFVGAFTERLFDAAGDDLPGAQLFVIGSRGLLVAAERSIRIDWSSPMASHSMNVPRLADRIAAALYERIASGRITRLHAIFMRTQDTHGMAIERRHLFPLEAAAFRRPADGNPPLFNVDPEALLAEFTADYVHAQLCDAALHAFAAENEARMEAMASARREIDQRLAALEATQRHVRQEEITAEIIELAAGEAASRADRGMR